MADSDLPLRNDQLAREETLETDRLPDVVPEKTEEALEDEVDEVTCHCPHRPQRKGSAKSVEAHHAMTLCLT
ncbi:unnamed protein product [Arctogadus glacialis]